MDKWQLYTYRRLQGDFAVLRNNLVMCVANLIVHKLLVLFVLAGLLVKRGFKCDSGHD